MERFHLHSPVYGTLGSRKIQRPRIPRTRIKRGPPAANWLLWSVWKRRRARWIRTIARTGRKWTQNGHFRTRTTMRSEVLTACRSLTAPRSRDRSWTRVPAALGRSLTSTIPTPSTTTGVSCSRTTSAAKLTGRGTNVIRKLKRKSAGRSRWNEI